jgi:hypothetical protein
MNTFQIVKSSHAALIQEHVHGGNVTDWFKMSYNNTKT